MQSRQRSARSHLWALAPIVLLTAFASPARAESAPTRDGFFLRVALGGSTLSMRREGSAGFGAPTYFLGESQIRGGAGISEISLGGTIGKVVLSGVLLMHQLRDPVLEEDGGGRRSLDGPLTFALLGLGVDVFPDPRGGFHLGGAIGLAGAWVRSPPPRWTEYLGGAGGGISLGAGYLWWLTRDWSIGLQGRATFARLHGEETHFGVTGAEDDTVSAISILGSAVFH